MVKKKISVAIACLVALLLPSCKFDINDFNPPSWEADLIGPLAFSEMRLEDVKELNGLEFSQSISAAEMNIPPFSGNIPGITLPDLGPYDIHFFSEFHYVEVDSVNLTVSIENNLPVDIDSGGTVELRNKNSGDKIYSYTLPEVIPKNSTFTFNIIVTDKSMEEYIELRLTSFSTLAENNATVTPDNSVTITLYLDFISIRRASVKASTSITISDTTDFSLQGEDLNVISVSGDFNTYVENGFPFSGELQAYFLAEGSETVYDSLFDEAYIEIPELNSDGEVISPLESKLVVTMDTTRVKKILNSKQVYFNILLHSPDSEPLIADNKYPVKAQLIGDLRVRVEN